MAMFGDDGGKTEKPTAQRLSETRDKGDTPLSKEVVQGGVMVMAGIMFWACGDWLVDGLAAALRRGLQVNETGSIDQVPHAYQAILGVVGHVVWPLATLLATFVVVTLVFGYGQIGVNISHGVLGIKLDKNDSCIGAALITRASDMLRAETTGGRTLEFTGRHDTTARGGKGWEAVKRANFTRVIPPEIQLVDWEEIEGKKKDPPTNGQSLFDTE